MANQNYIYQDSKKKTWYYKVFLGIDSNGKKVQKTKRGFKTRKEAKDALEMYMMTEGYKLKLEIRNSGKKEKKTIESITFEDFYHLHFTERYRLEVKRQTYENAQFIYQTKLQSFYPLKLTDITASYIEEWLLELSRTATRNSRRSDDFVPLSKSYINRIKGHLKIILDRAVSEGYIAFNPVDNVPNLPKENQKVEFWELDEFKKVMEQFKDSTIQCKQRKLVYEILFYSGIRIGELEALTWDDVDFKNHRITIKNTLVYKNKDDWYISTPKTKNAYRNIGIGKVLSAKLVEWKKLQSKIGNFKYVIQLDGTFTPPYCFASWLKQAAIEAGVKPIKLHALRHSHVALLIDKNVQPLLIKERMGHSNIQITLGTYGHLYAKSDEKIVSSIDSLLG
ncbi:site-specific integrase [Enterococcus cecorum]|nr:site-specific integrase [Enterococcus cecorum]